MYWCLQLQCLDYEPMVVISKVDLQSANGQFAADTLGKHPELDKLKNMVSNAHIAFVSSSCSFSQLCLCFVSAVDPVLNARHVVLCNVSFVQMLDFNAQKCGVLHCYLRLI